MAEVTIWGIHAGRTGDADGLFLKKKFIALGWNNMGDISKITPDRESIKKEIARTYPDKKPGAIPVEAGQLYRFLYEMKKGDLVIYPSKRERKIHIGQIEGDYRYDPKVEESYPNLRPVKWLKTGSRTEFSQAALYEIGSAMSLFQVKNYADEFIEYLEGKKPPGPPDEPVGPDVDEIEQMTIDFVKKELLRELKGHPFSDFVGHLLNLMGYKTRISPEGPDGGVDVIAHRDELGFEPPIIKVQVKSGEGNIGDPVVSALYGKVGVGEHGLLVTLGNFTKQAESFAKGKTNLRLINGEEFVGIVLAHYEEMDSRYKGIIPLKRTYVPETVQAEKEG